MKEKDVYPRLLEEARKLTSQSEPRDLVQTALLRSLEAEPSLASEDRLADASRRMRDALSSDRQTARRDGAIAAEARAGSKLAPRRRPQSRKRRRPKGVTGYNSAESGPLLLPTATAALPTVELQFAAQHLSQVLLDEIGDGCPCPPATADAILALYQRHYGVAPKHHWAVLLLREIESAKLAMLSAIDRDKDVGPPTATRMQLSRVKPSPGQDRKVVPDIEVVPYVTPKGRRMLLTYGDVDGKRAYLGAAVDTDEARFSYHGVTETDFPSRILSNVRLLLTLAPFPLQLPDHADEEELVAWVLQRMGFAGGGGQKHVKRETLLTWLCTPETLAKEIRRFATRRAEVADEETARRLLARSEALARKVEDGATDHDPFRRGQYFPEE